MIPQNNQINAKHSKCIIKRVSNFYASLNAMNAFQTRNEMYSVRIIERVPNAQLNAA
jgi:hypothetical protein